MQEIVTQQPDLGLDAFVREALTAIVAIKRQNKSLSLALVELPREPGQPDFSGEVVRHFAEFIIGHKAQSSPLTDQAREQIFATLAALEGTLAYTLKNAPEWLDQQWFLTHLQPIAQSSLSAMPCSNSC